MNISCPFESCPIYTLPVLYTQCTILLFPKLSALTVLPECSMWFWHPEKGRYLLHSELSLLALNFASWLSSLFSLSVTFIHVHIETSFLLLFVVSIATCILLQCMLPNGIQRIDALFLPLVSGNWVRLMLCWAPRRGKLRITLEHRHPHHASLVVSDCCSCTTTQTHISTPFSEPPTF